MLPTQDMTPVTGVTVEDMGHKMGLNGESEVLCAHVYGYIWSITCLLNPLCLAGVDNAKLSFDSTCPHAPTQSMWQLFFLPP